MRLACGAGGDSAPTARSAWALTKEAAGLIQQWCGERGLPADPITDLVRELDSVHNDWLNAVEGKEKRVRRFAYWLVETALAAACNDTIKEMRQEARKKKELKEAASLQTSLLQTVLNASSRAQAAGPSYGGRMMHTGGSSSFAGRGAGGGMLRQLPEEQKRQLYQQVVQQAGAHKGPDGKELCVDFLRQGYSVGNLAFMGLDRAACMGGCGKAHAQLPRGAITLNGMERTWRSPQNDPGVVAVKK